MTLLTPCWPFGQLFGLATSQAGPASTSASVTLPLFSVQSGLGRHGRRPAGRAIGVDGQRLGRRRRAKGWGERAPEGRRVVPLLPGDACRGQAAPLRACGLPSLLRADAERQHLQGGLATGLWNSVRLCWGVGGGGAGALGPVEGDRDRMSRHSRTPSTSRRPTPASSAPCAGNTWIATPTSQGEPRPPCVPAPAGRRPACRHSCPRPALP